VKQTAPDSLDTARRPGHLRAPGLGKRESGWTQPDGLDGLPLTTDQKVGGSSPSERATVSVGISAKTKSVLRRENVFWADDDPVNRVTTYIPWSIAKGTGLLQDEVPHQFGIHGVLEEQHHVMTRIHEEVSARMPKPDESRLLRLRPGVPVLDVWHTSIDQDGEPYELTRFVMRGDMTGLLYDVPVE
jgi:GntR family transcriptional regulator